jgi:hypothetical protein
MIAEIVGRLRRRRTALLVTSAFCALIALWIAWRLVYFVFFATYAPYAVQDIAIYGGIAAALFWAASWYSFRKSAQ